MFFMLEGLLSTRPTLSSFKTVNIEDNDENEDEDEDEDDNNDINKNKDHHKDQKSKSLICFGIFVCAVFASITKPHEVEALFCQ